MGTINDLNTTDTVADEDKFVLWKEQAGATRAITAENMATYFALSGGPYQPQDELLTSLAATGPTTTADRYFYTTAQDTVALGTITAFARTLLDDANQATALTTLGGQPLNARVTAFAGLTTEAGDIIEATGATSLRARKLQVATYAAARLLSGLTNGDIVWINGRTNGGDGGQGWFRVKASGTDNGGTEIVMADTKALVRDVPAGDVYVVWFGTDTTAMIAAGTAAGVNGRVLWTPGSYTQTAQLTMLNYQTFEGIGEVTITKAFNGDMIEAGAIATQIKNLRLEGAGGSFTGAGVVYSNASNGYQYTEDLWVLNTAGAPLKFATADAGQKSSHYFGLFRCFTSTLHGIELPTSGTETVGARDFIDCSGDGSPLIKFGKGINTRIMGGDSTGLDFSNSAGVSLRSSVIGHRLATAGVSITVDGNDFILQGCQIAGGLTIAASASRNVIGPNNFATGFTVADNSGVGGVDANRLYEGHQTFTPTWGVDSGGAPSIGNGTLTGALTHNGRSVRATISWVAGSTTTFGGGVWTFTLPAGFTAKEQTQGPAQAVRGNTRILVPVMAAGSNVVRLLAENQTNFVGATIPGTWANGDTLSFTIEFDRL
jgi:hypothetical protein